MSTQPINLETLSFEVVKQVTRPFLKIETGMTVYVKFLSPFIEDDSQFSERMRKSRKETEDEKQKPLDIATVVNLQTGEECRLIGHDVLMNTLQSEYKENGFVDKMFRITKGAKKGSGSRQYYSFEIAEIRMKTPVAAPAAKVVEPPAMPTQQANGPTQQRQTARR